MILKKYFLLMILMLNFSTYAQKSNQNIWKTLNNNNYSIQYPSDWIENQTGYLGTKFMIFSQLSSKDDKFRENINLIIQDLSKLNYDLDEYINISVKQITKGITNAKLIVSSRKKAKGKTFHKLIYTGKQISFKLKFFQYIWIENKKAYVLTFTAEESQYNYYKNTANKIMDSFKFE
jgi:serine/threonine-protein kinase